MGFITSALGIGNGYQSNAGGMSSQDSQANTAEAQQNYTNANNNLTGVGSQLQGVANGQGPNLGQAELNNATNQNNQQAASFIASQKGISPALAARQAAQMQGSNNQQAAGQAAVMNDQQQLGALGQLGSVYGEQGQMANNNLGSYMSAATAANQQNAQIAQNNANQQSGIAGGIMGGAGHALGFAKGGRVNYAGGGLAPSNPIDPGIAAGPAQFTTGSSSDGGESAGGGSDDANNPANMAAAQSQYGKMLDGSATGVSGAAGLDAGSSAGAGAAAAGSSGAAGIGSAAALAAAHGGKIPSHLKPHMDGGGLMGSVMSIIPLIAAMAAKGGKVPAMVSPGEKWLDPKKVNEVMRKGKNPMKLGQTIPGKAKVKGDSLKNDIVPRNLDPGGVVIPRHITQSKNADEKAKKFVQAVMTKQHLRGKK